MEQNAIRSHGDLKVWQKAMDLVVEVYHLSSAFPASENYRLVSQITRAAASVPANIAEGYGRESTKDYCRFLSIARGSVLETETFLMLAVRLGYLSDQDANPTLDSVTRISKMLTSLKNRVAASPQ